jgi:hypothetical protein
VGPAVHAADVPFATTFYLLSVYPEPAQVLVACLPLYQSTELLRGLALGTVDVSSWRSDPNILSRIEYCPTWYS